MPLPAVAADKAVIFVVVLVLVLVAILPRAAALAPPRSRLGSVHRPASSSPPPLLLGKRSRRPFGHLCDRRLDRRLDRRGLGGPDGLHLLNRSVPRLRHCRERLLRRLLVHLSSRNRGGHLLLGCGDPLLGGVRTLLCRLEPLLHVQ